MEKGAMNQMIRSMKGMGSNGKQIHDRLAMGLFSVVRDIRDKEELSEVVSSYIARSGISTDQLYSSFYPTFMAYFSNANGSLEMSSIILKSMLSVSEWNGRSIQ